MNLAQLDELIKSLNPKTDKDLIIFYTKKRKDLTKTISSKINKDLKSNKYAKGGGLDFLKPMTHDEFVKNAKEQGYKNLEEAVSLSGYRWNGEKFIDKRIKPYTKQPKYGKGGGLDENGIDLFEDYENIPEKVQTILDKYAENFGDDFGDMDYKDMADMHDEVYAVGYTFESGLDNQPYDLRPIGTKGKSEFEQFAKGGGIKGLFTKAKDLGAKSIQSAKSGYQKAKQKTNSALHNKKKEIALDVIYDVKENLAKGEERKAIEKAFNVVEKKYAKGGYVFKGDKYVYVPKEFIYTIGNL